MSVLFSSKKIGPVEVKNRFISAPTCECMATENGEVTDQLINRTKAIAKGGAGLIIPGQLFINSAGKSVKLQTGIQEDGVISGLKKLTEAVHEHGCKIFFELNHAGRQKTKETIGQTPLAPSAGKADQAFRVKPESMTNEKIKDTINDFGEAARRANDSGADGILIHAANGYLLNEFLSPFFNQRTDEWGGSDENKYRILHDTIEKCRKAINKNMALTVKLSTNDYTPKQGITPDLAKKYARYLIEDGIDGLVTSQGTVAFSSMNIWKGDVPVSEILKSMPLWMRPIGWLMLRRLVGKYDFEEPWNLADAKIMKEAIGDIPLLLGGGLRKLATMQKAVEDGEADFVYLGRPFIREPNLVNKFQTGQTEVAACVSCNKCTAASLRNLPLRCHCES